MSIAKVRSSRAINIITPCNSAFLVGHGHVEEEQKPSIRSAVGRENVHESETRVLDEIEAQMLYESEAQMLYESEAQILDNSQVHILDNN
jgi:hypothetical protein